jgi:hypothetical protein
MEVKKIWIYLVMTNVNDFFINLKEKISAVYFITVIFKLYGMNFIMAYGRKLIEWQ